MGTDFLNSALQGAVPARQVGPPIAPSVGVSSKWVDAHGNLVPGPAPTARLVPIEKGA